ncbi:MFS transporter [Paenibacillus harenae]|uniref:MFS transporter n=1 Tax=Paenibacillus harenae TaxID=306543 RepID=UPI0027D82C4F|nr:MFS transporter [Paenibacillus harenae]
MQFHLSLLYLLYYMGLGAYAPYLSLYLHDQGVSGSQTGLILALGSLAGIIAQPLFGLLNDRSKDYRTMLRWISLLAAIVVLSLMLDQGLFALIVCFVLFSFISSPTSPLIDAIAVQYGSRFRFSFGEVRVWGAIGFSVITLIAGYLFHDIGYKYIFAAYALFAILVFLVMFKLPAIPKIKAAKLQVEKGIFLQLVTNWRFVLFIVIGLLVSGNTTMNFNYLSIFLQRLDYPVELVGWSFTVAALVEIPLFWLSYKVIRRFGLFPLLIGSVFMYAFKYVAMSFAPPTYVIILLQAVDGVALVFYFSTAVEIVNQMAPANGKATAQTMFAAAGGIAGIAANMVAGWVVDHQGPQFLFGMMGAIGITAAMLFLLFPAKSGNRQQVQSAEA